jgi:hypothetical protein
MPITYSAIANREVRTIKKGWMHPKDENDRYRPLFEAGHTLEEGQEPWPQMPDASGLPPAQTQIVAYETTSEGTPISPAFPNTPGGRLAIVNYCAEHATTFADTKADAETWAAILFGGGAAVDLDDGSVHFA